MWKRIFGKKNDTPDIESDHSLSNLALDRASLPRHIAIVMDGNGRWAEGKGKSRSAGHEAGARTLKRIVRAASHIGIEVLTVSAVSTENW